MIRDSSALPSLSKLPERLHTPLMNRDEEKEILEITSVNTAMKRKHAVHMDVNYSLVYIKTKCRNKQGGIEHGMAWNIGDVCMKGATLLFKLHNLIIKCRCGMAA